jgi:hypothetical protein
VAPQDAHERLLLAAERRQRRCVGLPTFAAGDLTLDRRPPLVVADDVVEHVFHPIPEPASHARR